MKNSSQLEILKLVNNKLEVKRDELMDVINSSLSSFLPNRVNIVYEAQLELANVEKALEINRYFQIQIQEQVLEKILENSIDKSENDSKDSKDSEDLKK